MEDVRHITFESLMETNSQVKHIFELSMRILEPGKILDNCFANKLRIYGMCTLLTNDF